MNFISRINSFDFEQKLLVFVTVSLFLPMEVSSIVLISYVFYCLYNKTLISSIRLQPGALFLYGFVLLEIVVSLIYKNYTGVLNSVGIGVVVLYIAKYRRVITQDLFLLILDLSLFLSLLAAVFGLFEFNMYSKMAGYSFFDFYVQNKPSRRIHVFFMNANLYAMMIEFFVVVCLYRWVQVKSISLKIYYIFVGSVNLLMLYLTGCRTAFAPIAIAVPVFFMIFGNKKYIFITLCLLGCAVCGVLFIPNLIPRLSDVSTLYSRFKIWNGAIQAFLMYPLFGNGPQTYGHLYPVYHWHKAPHAHNIYIDSFASYGVVGTALMCVYSVYLFRDVYFCRKDKALFAMMICFLLIFFVHGLFDCTLNVICCSVFFFMILNARKVIES